MSALTVQDRTDTQSKYCISAFGLISGISLGMKPQIGERATSNP